MRRFTNKPLRLFYQVAVVTIRNMRLFTNHAQKQKLVIEDSADNLVRRFTFFNFHTATSPLIAGCESYPTNLISSKPKLNKSFFSGFNQSLGNVLGSLHRC